MKHTEWSQHTERLEEIEGLGGNTWLRLTTCQGSVPVRVLFGCVIALATLSISLIDEVTAWGQLSVPPVQGLGARPVPQVGGTKSEPSVSGPGQADKSGTAGTTGQSLRPDYTVVASASGPLLPISADLYGATSASAISRNRTRVKDVASIEGIRDNQLIGYGIVVGLRGTGDTQQTVYPIQTLLSTLERMGITVPQTGNNSASNMQVKNMAGVFVVATMPAFSRPGSKLDITVSSGGDARSLEGGVLLMTPLYGPDGQVYAQAQGPLVLGGYQVSGAGAAKSVNHPTTARIPSGALVERIVPFDLRDMRTVSVVLNDADFHTAERMAAAINSALKVNRAHAADSRRVDIATDPAEDLPALLDQVEAVEIDVYPKARVVVNERTGTVVIGGKVRLQPVSILHGGLSINVITETKVSQPNAFSSGTTQVTQQTTIQAQDKPVNRIELKEGATVEDLVQELQQIGATARDVISILQGMKEAGALEADLEIL